MKTKMIYSKYDKETRVSTTTVTNNYGTFTGYATCHPDDDVSSFFGCSLAECRANLKAFREEKKIIRYQIKALKEAYEMFSNAKNFNNNSNEARKVRKLIKMKESKMTEIENDIQSLLEYIRTAPDLRQKAINTIHNMVENKKDKVD